jgi:hypothetical protein
MIMVVWVTNPILICDFIADFIQNWLEDNIKPELYDNMKKTVEIIQINKNLTLTLFHYLKTI